MYQKTHFFIPLTRSFFFYASQLVNENRIFHGIISIYILVLLVSSFVVFLYETQLP